MASGDLRANRVEVKKMLLTEYNETQTMELFKEEGREEGRIQGRAEGRAVGRAEGETKLGILINKLMALGRIGDIEKAATDPASRDRLYTEFGMA
jgi:predicted transposase YdaD